MIKKTISIAIIPLLLIGCGMGNKNPGNTNGNTNVTVQEKQRVPQTNEQQKQNLSATETANRLADLATKVPNVNDATVIVMGNTAIVGIDVNAKLDRPRVGTIKYTVAEALKKDPYGKTAIVIADPDVVQRIREMNQDIKRGRPIAGFAEELADIAGRFMPQLPSAVPETQKAPVQPSTQQK